MRFIVDQCVPVRFARLLNTLGHIAEYSSKYLPADATDTDVLSLADSMDAVLLTVDLNFSDVRSYVPSQHSGIVILRQYIGNEADAESTLQHLLHDQLQSGISKRLVIVMPHRYRVRE